MLLPDADDFECGRFADIFDGVQSEPDAIVAVLPVYHGEFLEALVHVRCEDFDADLPALLDLDGDAVGVALIACQ